MSARRWIPVLVAGLAIGLGLPGCGTAKKLSEAELEAIGVRNGVRYWEAQGKLGQRGYRCYVTGAKRENFNCTRTEGVFPTCVLRITFVADDRNLVSNLTVKDPACVGTP